MEVLGNVKFLWCVSIVAHRSICNLPWMVDVPWGVEGYHKVKGHRQGSRNLQGLILIFMVRCMLWARHILAFALC